MRDYSKTKLVYCDNDAEHLELLHLLKMNGFTYSSGQELDDKNVPSTSAYNIKTGCPVHLPYAVHLDEKIIAFTCAICLRHLEKQYGRYIEFQDFLDLFMNFIN